MKFNVSKCIDCPLLAHGEESDWDYCNHPEWNDKDAGLSDLCFIMDEKFPLPESCPLRKEKLIIELTQDEKITKNNP